MRMHVWTGLLLACACTPMRTITTTTPATTVHSVVLVSVHGSTLHNTIEQDSVGDEAIGIMVGDTYDAIARWLPNVRVVEMEHAKRSPHYDRLPESLPQDEWTQVDNQLAVDVHAKDATSHLADLADEVHVDAAIVVRHDWWLSYEPAGAGVLVDHMTILMVHRDGQVLVRDRVVVDQPLSSLFRRPSFIGSLSPSWGLNGAAAQRELVGVCRQAGRAAWDRFLEARSS
jgi:hypothetical protein